MTPEWKAWKFKSFVGLLTWSGDGSHQAGCLRGSLLLTDVLWLYFLCAIVFRFLVFSILKSLLVEVTHKGRLCAVVIHTWVQSSLSQFSLLRCVPKAPDTLFSHQERVFLFLTSSLLSPFPPFFSSPSLSLLPPCVFIFLETLYDLVLLGHFFPMPLWLHPLHSTEVLRSDMWFWIFKWRLFRALRPMIVMLALLSMEEEHST